MEKLIFQVLLLFIAIFLTPDIISTALQQPTDYDAPMDSDTMVSTVGNMRNGNYRVATLLRRGYYVN